MEKGRIVGVSILLSLIFILLATSVSAGFSDLLKDWLKITGYAPSQPTNISITVTGINPAQITYVSAIDATNPTENSSKAIAFYLTMYDADGVADLNDTSVSSNFSRAGETTRQNSSCSLVGDINGNSANYSCTINMLYWDGNGAWTINTQGRDLGNTTLVYNTSTSFTYNLLKAMAISPTSLTWSSVSPGATNQTSNNDPTIINNTGNYNSTINVTGIELYGETNSSEKIFAANFTIGLSTGGANPECIGTALANATAKIITGSFANRGNLSAGSGAGQEQFYYCIPTVPSGLSSQTYSTLQGGSWTIAY